MLAQKRKRFGVVDEADELRASSKLTASEYSVPMLGLIFLRCADFKFAQADKALKGGQLGRRRTIGKTDSRAVRSG